MAGKEINVFSVSFLDLLSGALAAVIILFVIVPKMTSEQENIVETVDSLNVQVNELDSLIQLAQNSVSNEIYEQVQDELNEIRENLDEAREQAENMQQEIQNTRQRNRQLEGQLVETENRIREMEEALAAVREGPTREQMEELQRELAEARAELEEQRNRAAQGAGGPGASMYGVNAKFAVICDWRENLDVDLYLKNTANNEWICYNCGNHRWAEYLGDVTSRSQGDGRFEMIYQIDEIIPGQYEVWYHLYSGSGIANVTGYAVIHPFTNREKKVKFDPKSLRHTHKPTAGGGIKIGTLHVSNTSISLN